MLNPFSSDLRGKQRAKPAPPETDSFVADVDAALVQQVFHISKQEWITYVHHNRQADDLRADFEVLEYVGFGHDRTLRKQPALHKPVSSDTAEECFVIQRCYKLSLPASSMFNLTEPGQPNNLAASVRDYCTGVLTIKGRMKSLYLATFTIPYLLFLHTLLDW